MANENQNQDVHKVVVVGGGAGGLELVTKLGQKFGKKGLAEVTLIDGSRTHIWKPLLHEIAAGTLNSNIDELGYLGHAHWNNYIFRLGNVISVDRVNQTVTTSPTLDENGKQYIPSRTFAYDTLILAVGSQTNDFGVKGVAENCYFLDKRKQADLFHQDLIKAAYAAHTQEEPLREGQLHIAIAGAGATGVELAAELHDSLHLITQFGLNKIKPEEDIKIHIVEAADRILPALPDRLSNQAAATLAKIGVQLHTGKRISEATDQGFQIGEDEFIPAEFRVWAAGIKAPQFLTEIDGLETNRINQLVVDAHLQTADPNIFALGDCAAYTMKNGQNVPPRAQSAHQMASMLYKTVKNRIHGKSEMPEYKYVDYGSLVNLSRYSTVGSLMGGLSQKFSSSVFIEGLMARFVYWSLYKMHLMAINGAIRTAFGTIANFLTRKHKPRTKFH